MHTEQEILHVFMDLPNELCSVPTVCYTLPFFFFQENDWLPTINMGEGPS